MSVSYLSKALFQFFQMEFIILYLSGNISTVLGLIIVIIIINNIAIDIRT